MRLKANNAKALAFKFDKFNLPEGCLMHIFDANYKQIIGGFSYKNNNGNAYKAKDFFTGYLLSDEAIIEVYVPKSLNVLPVVSLKNIVYCYRGFKIDKNTRSFGDGASCQINTSCNEGISTLKERDGVLLTIRDGVRQCTGTLLSNTRGDCRRLVLTADHCLRNFAQTKYINDAIDNPDASNWSFLWFYHSKFCGSPNSESAINTMRLTNGATLLANDKVTDFALFDLDELPSEVLTPEYSLTPYFNGWNREDEQQAGGVSIHHPQNDIKKISTYTITPSKPTNCFPFKQSTSTLNVTDPNNWWEIQWVMTSNGFGIVEPGSSGAPLFNNHNLVIGQLQGRGSCEEFFCNDPEKQKVFYGKISKSWDGYNTNLPQRRLRDWLDPINLNPASINGGFCDGCKKDYRFIDGAISSNTIYQSSGDLVTIAKVLAPSGNALFRGENLVMGDFGFEVELGAFSILEVGECQTMIQPWAKQQNQGVDTSSYEEFKVYPNPTQGKCTVKLNSEIFKVEVYNLKGEKILVSSDLNIDLTDYSKGIYLLKIILNNGQFKTKQLLKI